MFSPHTWGGAFFNHASNFRTVCYKNTWPNRRGRVSVIPLRAPLLWHYRQALSMVRITTPGFIDFRNLDDGRKCLNLPAEVFTLLSQDTFSSEVAITDLGNTLRGDFHPSRMRRIPAIIADASSGAQRSGEALPGFLPRGAPPPAALEIAREIDHYNRLLENHVAPATRCKARTASPQPKLVKTNRRRAIRFLTSLSIRTQTNQRRLARVLSGNSPARRLDIPLISFLLSKMRYIDTILPADLTKGMRIAWEISTSHVFPNRVTPDVAKLDALKRWLRARNRAIVSSITKTPDPILRAKFRELPWKEHEQGRLSNPTPLTNHDLKTLVAPSVLYFCTARASTAQVPGHRRPIAVTGKLRCCISRHVLPPGPRRPRCENSTDYQSWRSRPLRAVGRFLECL